MSGRSKPEEKASQGSGVMRAERPRPRLDADRMAYHLVQPRGPSSPTLLEAYDAWRNGWRDTLRELDGLSDIRSDEFTRLDHVGVLTFEGRCVSVTGLRWLDLSLPFSVHDSYFAAWPPHVIESLGGGVLGITCNTIVVSGWRGGLVQAERCEPISLKDLTIRMSLRRFLGSPARIFVGVSRNDRGMDRVAGDLGCRRMARITMHGIESDICGWARSDVTELGPIVDTLWGRRTSDPA